MTTSSNRQASIEREIEYASLDARVDAFIDASRQLNGCEIEERACWNSVASADAIRHFAYGISDANPLWIEPLYAARSRYECLVAPPAFVASVLYPALHGAPMDVPLSNLISELECEWYLPILENDALHAVAKQTGVQESRNRQGKRIVHIIAEIDYWNQRSELVARAISTMVRTPQSGTERLTERAVYSYSDAELRDIQQALDREERTGQRKLDPDNLVVGHKLPTLVRGPLTIGDMICWQAAIGPSYRGGALGYLDGLKAPHTMARNPLTGWPVKYSQQHEDVVLSKQRGMPAPFDNTVMRWGWISVLLTNWMGDTADLKRLRIHAVEPVLYGDTNWYEGTVSKLQTFEDHQAVTVRLTGRNQLGIVTTTGDAEIEFPLAPRPQRSAARGKRAPDDVMASGDVATPFARELFEEQVRRSPDAIALRFEGETLTYDQLNRRANAAAHRLLARGGKANMLIGVCVERSLAMVIAQLACLKAGVAYVPLDPDIPDERLEQMVGICNVEMLISEPHKRGKLPRSLAGMTLIDVEELAVHNEQTDNPVHRATPDDLAYVMFTSGSVGAPRAAAVMHASLGIYLASLVKEIPLHPDDIYLHAASASFSAAIRQTLLPLCSGASLVIAGMETRRDPRLLLRLLRDSSATVWDTVPSIWRACVEVLRAMPAQHRSESLSSRLGQILVTGEPLPWDIPYAWAHEFGHRARVTNLYSQTETSGTVCLYTVPDEAVDQEGVVPLGRPLNGVSVHILDENLQPVSNGQTGELCVAGKRIAAGYLNQPDVTAERFVADPFSKAPGARLYRTGDLVCLGSDGNITMRGRKDHRVKLRGFSIDLTEVEGALRMHPQVREAVTIMHDVAVSDRILVAYVVPAGEDRLTVDQFFSFLVRKLPDYMVPGAYVWLDELPLTASGKLDRTGLPQLERSRPSLSGEYVAPREIVESMLVSIWEDVLNIDDIGVDDDFLVLGGHSLLATTVMSRVSDLFGVELPVRMLFEHSTVAGLAPAIADEMA